MARPRLLTDADRQAAFRHLELAARARGEAVEDLGPVFRRLHRVRLLPAGRVLWVDSRPDHHLHEVLALDGLGLRLVQATTLAAAAQCLAGASFDLVVTCLDLEGDDLGGVRLAQAVRGGRQPLPVLVYSRRAAEHLRDIEGVGARLARHPQQLLQGVLDVLRPEPSAASRRPALPPWLPPPPRLSRPVVALLAAAALVAAGTGAALSWLATQPPPPPCVALLAGQPVAVGAGSAGCALPVARASLALDCGRDLTIAPTAFLRESRRYAGDLAPASGDGWVVVRDGTCQVDSPEAGVETELRSARPQPADVVVVVDFRPTTTTRTELGVAARGTRDSRGVGVYLYSSAGSGGGEVGENPPGSEAVTPLHAVAQDMLLGQSNRLVVCAQGGRVQGWLNGQRLLSTSQPTSIARRPGDVTVSLMDLDPSAPATAVIRHVGVYEAAPGTGC